MGVMMWVGTIIVETSFLLALLGGSLLGCGGGGSDLDFLKSFLGGGVEGLSAVLLDGPDAAILDGLLEEGSGDGTDDFVFLDQVGSRDVLAELGDVSDNSIVSHLVDEDGVVGFFFDFSLGPFLHWSSNTLVVTFFFCAPPAFPPAEPFAAPLSAAFAISVEIKILLF
jgi:hypothetical protein